MERDNPLKRLNITEQDRENFKVLVNKWKSETWHHSSFDIMQDKDSYRAIIAMGEKAIPLILESLQRERSWLLLALDELRDQVMEGEPIGDSGMVAFDIKELTRAALLWGEKEGYIKPNPEI